MGKWCSITYSMGQENYLSVSGYRMEREDLNSNSFEYDLLTRLIRAQVLLERSDKRKMSSNTDMHQCFADRNTMYYMIKILALNEFHLQNHCI